MSNLAKSLSKEVSYPCNRRIKHYTGFPMKKTCTKCHGSFPLTDYHRDKKNKDGFAARCKSCKNAQKRKVLPKVSQAISRPKIEKKPVAVPQNVEIDYVGVLSELYKKYNCFCTITLGHNEHRVQIFGKDGIEVHKGSNPDKLVADLVK